MAFHGDLTSYPLPELLQWLDGSRKTGALTLGWEGGERKLYLLAGQGVATSAPGLAERLARLQGQGRLAPAERVFAALAALGRGEAVEAAFAVRGLSPTASMELAQAELLGAVADLTQDGGGSFHWTEDGDRTGEEWAPLAVSLRELLFESLRWVDEAPDVERTLPADSLLVHARTAPAEHLPVLTRVILQLCQEGMSLARLRLALGTSRAATHRRVFDLMRLKLVEVDGAAPPEADPIADMLAKGAVLVHERQYEAAGLVASSLLASDPVDRRVREFARMVEREHIAALYEELPPLCVLGPCVDPEGQALLRPEDRHLLTLVNGAWDVSTVVLACQARELDTLRALARLLRLGLVAPLPGTTARPAWRVHPER